MCMWNTNATASKQDLCTFEGQTMEMNFSQLKDSLFHKFVLGKTENDKCLKVSVTTASGCAPQPVGAPTFVPPCRNLSPRRSLHLASVSQRVYSIRTLQVLGGSLSLIAKWSPTLTWKRKSCQIDCSLALVA